MSSNSLPPSQPTSAGRFVGNAIALIVVLLILAAGVDWLAIHVFGANEGVFYCRMVAWAAKSGIGGSLAMLLAIGAVLAFALRYRDAALMFAIGAFVIPFLPDLLTGLLGLPYCVIPGGIGQSPPSAS